MKHKDIRLVQIVVSAAGILLSGFYILDNLLFMPVFEPEYWLFLVGFIVLLTLSILSKKK